MANGRDALTGGAMGAGIGSNFGPWGAAIGGGLGALGGLFGVFSNNAEQKRLRKRQEEMAAAMAERAKQNEQARLNARGQALSAYAPHNQMMASQFGADAAFTPQEMSNMARDPMAQSRASLEAKMADSRANMQPVQDTRKQMSGRAAAGSRAQGRAMPDRNGGTTMAGPQMEAGYADAVRRMEEDERRRAEVEAAFAARPLQGPAPISMPKPQAARRY